VKLKTGWAEKFIGLLQLHAQPQQLVPGATPIATQIHLSHFEIARLWQGKLSALHKLQQHHHPHD